MGLTSSDVQLKNKTETALDITTLLSVCMRLITKSQQIITERGMGRGVQQAGLLPNSQQTKKITTYLVSIERQRKEWEKQKQMRKNKTAAFANPSV